MTRNAFSGSLFRGQADFYFPAGTQNRVSGINVSNTSCKIFYNNSPLSWSFVDGTSVSDSSISSGSVYFNEINGCPGYYSFRFFPDKIGYWRLVFSSNVSGTEYSVDIDVVSQNNPNSGLNASFS